MLNRVFATGHNMNADRNLLFGILAWQAGVITEAQLLSAMQQWTFDKGKSLGEVLVDQSVLTQEQYAELSRMVESHLKLHNDDANEALNSLSSLPAVTKTIRKKLDDSDIHASLDRCDQTVIPGAVTGNEDRWSTFVKPVRHGESRFHIIRPHARGGLGEVFVANDEELNREVALKEIQSNFADDVESRHRFVLEAEVTGGLEHPGIVPVYGLGQYEDGRPYYAMRFIKGQSLKEAITEFYEDKNLTESERSLQMRKLLGRFIDVCQAIGYAHSRGVLHRDLKPGNIMLGKYGETLVVDWGLAKVKGRDESSLESGEQTLKPASGDSATPTMAGSAIGTPAYMPPEQAAGRLDELGPASDVYSLGATLYHLLTGQPPFQGKNYVEILRAVQNGDFVEPLKLNDNIAKPLNAVCVKAMSLAPADRYSNPQELAADVEKFLADEPIDAFREPIAVRAKRAIRNHPRAVGSLAASLVLGLIASVTISTVLSTTNSKLVAARDAERQLREQTQLAVIRAAERRYANQLRLAQVQWANGQLNLARKTLSECDWSLRGWEHDYLYTLLHPDCLELKCEYTDVFPPESFDTRSYSSSGNFQCFAISNDGLSAAGGGKEFGCTVATEPSAESKSTLNPVVVWDAVSGQIRHILRGHSAPIAKIAFSSSGKSLVSGDEDGNVYFWDPVTGKQAQVLPQQDGAITDLIYTPDDEQVIISNRESLCWWDIASGEIVHEIERGYSAIALSQDGKLLAGGARMDFKHGRLIWGLEIIDVETDSIIQHCLGHDNEISTIAFSNDSRQILSAAGSITQISIAGAEDADSEPVLIPGDHEVAMWSIKTGERVGRIFGHADKIRSMSLSADGLYLATGSDDGTANLWNLKTGEQLRSYPVGNPVRSIQFSQSDQELLINNTIWAVREHDGIPVDDQFTLELVCGSEWLLARGVYDVHSWTSDTAESTGQYNGVPDIGQIGFVHRNYSAFDYSELSQLVAMGLPAPENSRSEEAQEHDGAIQVTRFPSGQVVWSFRPDGSGVRDLDFSSDGKLLAVALGGVFQSEEDFPVLVFSAESGEKIAEFEGVDATRVAWAPDCNNLLCLSDENESQIQLWDVAQKRILWKRKWGHGGDVCWRPDGEQLCVCDGSYKAIQVYDSKSGSMLFGMNDQDRSNIIRYSPEGDRLFAGTKDGALTIWNSETGEKTLELVAPNVRVDCLTVSPDGKQVFTTGQNESGVSSSLIRRWRASRRHHFTQSDSDRLRGKLRNSMAILAVGYSRPDLVREAEFLVEHYDTELNRETLGMAYCKNGQYHRATGLLKNANDWRSLGFQAIAHYRTGRFNDAQKSLEEMKKDMASEGVTETGPGLYPLYDEVNKLLSQVQN